MASALSAIGDVCPVCTLDGRLVSEKKVTLADFFPQPPPPKVIDEYPHRCPRCHAQAYVGFNTVDHWNKMLNETCKVGSLR